MYRDSPDSGQRLHLPQLRLGTPGDLVAAIPALLGFTPHDSLLFVVLAPVSRAIDCIGRVNLTMPDDNLSAKLDDLVGLCLHAQSSEVLMIVVCGPAYTLDETALPTYRELAGKVSAYLHSHGICLRSAWATAEITPRRPVVVAVRRHRRRRQRPSVLAGRCSQRGRRTTHPLHSRRPRRDRRP